MVKVDGGRAKKLERQCDHKAHDSGAGASTGARAATRATAVETRLESREDSEAVWKG